jgi:hypothetical protein
MSDKPLGIVGVEIYRPREVEAADAGPGVQPRLQVSVRVANPRDQPLHVWSTRRAYEYDASARVLTLYLTDHKPPPPPGIEMISEHPRTPSQIVVAPRGDATFDVPVPTTIRRRVPGEGLGMHFVEEPIGPIDHVDLHIQYAPEPLQQRAKEDPIEHRERLQAHGEVVRATIQPTEQKER